MLRPEPSGWGVKCACGLRLDPAGPGLRTFDRAMNDILQKIVNETPGARAAILMGFDGIAVDQFVDPDVEDPDIESMAMEFSFRFIELRTAAESRGMGALSDITVKAEFGTFLVVVGLGGSGLRLIFGLVITVVQFLF